MLIRSSDVNLKIFLIMLICIPLGTFLYVYSSEVFGTYFNFKSNYATIKTNSMIFKEYLKKFNKNYSPEEYSRRYSYFKESLQEISRLNAITGAVHGLTKFSDMSKEEFSKFMLRSIGQLKRIGDYSEICTNNTKIKIENSYLNFTGLPDVVDWRNSNKIGPILYQGRCACCWAMGVVGLVESMALIQEIEKTYTRRSVQELIDCLNGLYNNHGCQGGTIQGTLEYLCTNNYGIRTEEDYPLTLNDDKCYKPFNNESRKIKQYWLYRDMNESHIEYYLYKHGPLAVVVNADPWMHYMGGVIQRACIRSKDHYTMDHVVQLVGYDKSGSIPYYIVRNSWGEDFGDKGYVKLVMYKNICGVRDEVTRLEVY